MTMARLFLLSIGAALAISALWLPACGTATCDRGSKCTADDPADVKSAQKACSDALSKETSCRSEREGVISCTDDNQVCGSDNKTDTAATLAATQKNCADKQKAYDTCINAAVDAGVTH
jgi:hypothetical protein